MSLSSLKKDLQQCQAKIQSGSFEEALNLCDQILKSKDGNFKDLDSDEATIIFTALSFKGLVLMSLAKNEKDQDRREKLLEESEKSYMKANEVDSAKFPSWKGLMDLYIYRQQDLKYQYKYTFGFEEIFTNETALETNDLYTSWMKKLGPCIDRFVELRGYVNHIDSK